MKKIKLHRKNIQVHLEDIKKEIYMLNSLMHPRIIRYYAHFIHTNLCANILMEYASKGSLYTLLNKRMKFRRYLTEEVSC